MPAQVASLRTLLVALVILACSQLLANAAAESGFAASLLSNGGFEEELDPAAPAWRLLGQGVTVADTEAHTGRRSAMLAPPAGGQAAISQVVRLPESGAKVIRFSAYIKNAEAVSEPRSRGLWARFVHPSTGKPSFFSTFDERQLASDWTPQALWLYVPPGVGSVIFGVGNGSAQALAADDLQAWVLDPSGETIAPANTAVGQWVAEITSTIRTAALNAGLVDWPLVERAMRLMTAQSRSTSDAAKALKFALSALGDGHSHLISQGSSTVAAPSGEGPATTPEPSIRHADVRGATYVEVPGFISAGEPRTARFAAAIREVVTRSAVQGSCGFIVDLRSNFGGNMHPMLSGLKGLLGDGTLGYYVSPEGRSPWAASNLSEQAVLDATRGVLPNPADLEAVPVALLIGPRTASSGEIVAIAFSGRINTRTFGERTAGLATANRPFKLSDGSIIALTVADIVDRNGLQFASGVTPDVKSQGVSTGSLETDRGVQDAREWLASRCPRR